ncbi:hypothetical protein AVEN_214254-1 [Araneus ventricosus]|uniref:PiggyBac transposable element-derived protein domain-containing protein n=1 Tax=Araneus ventricosus TaxID=182803 RepID=A0A4Y2UAX1_ARAVE|nr:hypothetical protein AVEN_214254-1 [Araneus ventricosus]
MHPPTANTLENMSEGLKKLGNINSYNKNMVSVDLSDRIANSFGFSRNTMKWPMKLFHCRFKCIHFVQNEKELIPDSTQYIWRSKFCKKIDHKTFRLNLIRQMIEINCNVPAVPRKVRVSDDSAGHWPEKKGDDVSNITKNKKQTKTWIQCKSCGVGLCVGTCY